MRTFHKFVIVSLTIYIVWILFMVCTPLVDKNKSSSKQTGIQDSNQNIDEKSFHGDPNMSY